MSTLREKRPIAKRCIAAGLYQKLVTKLGSHFTIKQNLVAHLNHQLPKGEFLHVMHQARNVFVFVAPTNAEGYRQALSAQDVNDLLYFQQALLPADLLQHAYRLAPFLIIAANDKNHYEHLNAQGFCFMNKMAVNRVVSLIKNKALAKASPAIQHRLQSIFSPETFIPPILSADATPFLDQTQDKILKQSLCPTSYSSSYAAKTHLYQGIAGSGKTLVLLQRAKLLKQLNPTWKIVVIAPNTTTLHVLQTMRTALALDATIEIIAFQHWCRRHIKGVVQFMHTDEALELAEHVLKQYFADQREKAWLTAKQLVQELIYSADRALDTLDRYLVAKRATQAATFDLDYYVCVWKVMQAMAQALHVRHAHMASDLAPLLWYQVLEGKVDLPQYDAILIDDAHTLAPVGFKLLYQARRMRRGQVVGHVFMVAKPYTYTVDPALQSLQPYQLSTTWQEAGIRVTEHETTLHQCYRNSVGIFQLADQLLPIEHQMSTTVIRGQKSSKHWRWPHKTPVLFHVTREREEFDLLLKEIVVLLDRGMQAKDILIIQAGKMPVRKMAMLLRQQLGITVSVFGDPQQSERTLYIAPLEALSAVQSPVVFIVGLHHLLASNTTAITTDTPVSAHKLEKLYTGIMRAQHQLTLILVANSVPSALKLKGLKIVKNPLKKNNVYPLFPL